MANVITILLRSQLIFVTFKNNILEQPDKALHKKAIPSKDLLLLQVNLYQDDKHKDCINVAFLHQSETFM